MAKKHKKQKKWIFRLIVLVLFVTAAVVVYLVWDAYFKDKKSNEDSGQSNEQTEIVEEVSEPVKTGEIVEKPKVVQYDGEDPNALEELSGVVTYAGVAGENLMVRVNIDQYLEEGECELVLMRNGTTVYNSTARIIGNVATATCEGFDVPISYLGSGAMEVMVNLNSDGKSGVIQGRADI